MRARDEFDLPDSCLNKALDNEMIFVLLGRDPAAPAAILAWCNERIRLGLNTDADPKIAQALECANKMAEERSE